MIILMLTFLILGKYGSNGHGKVQWKTGGPFDPFDKWNVQWPLDFSILMFRKHQRSVMKTRIWQFYISQE
jgi:hypothetical protein